MNKLKKIGYYNIETGEEIDETIFSAITKEHIKNRNKEIYKKMIESPLDLTVEEIEFIRKSQGVRNPTKVNLKYKKGFYMSSQNEENIYDKLNPLTVYLLHMCGYRMNKDGLLKYKNGRAIRSFADLREYYNLSYYKWKLIMMDIDKFNLIKEQLHDKEKYLVVNPIYSSSQYEITMYKFMAFHKELKNHLTELEYLYLCKKFDIIP